MWGQSFNETGKVISEQKRNHWCKHYKIQRFCVDVDKAYCVKRLVRSPTPKPTSSRTLCSVWEYGTWSLSRLGRAQLNGIRENNHFKDMNRIDGMPTVFEWKIFPGITTLGLLEKIQSLMRDLQCEPEHITDRIIFMSMYNDTTWREKGNTERCEYNSQTVAGYARKFPRGHWSFLGLGSDKKWYENLHRPNPTDPGIEWQRI